MPAPPKPERRGPKPRKPIKRSAPVHRIGTRPRRKRSTKVLMTVQMKGTLDSLFSRMKIAEDPTCPICRRRPSTDAMHFFSRRYRVIRWHTMNARAGCRRCHTILTSQPKIWKSIWSEWLGPVSTASLTMLKNRFFELGFEEVKSRLESQIAGGKSIEFAEVENGSLDVFREGFLP